MISGHVDELPRATNPTPASAQMLVPLLDHAWVGALAKRIGDELDTLQPAEDKANYYFCFLGAVIRDQLRSAGQRPNVVLHQNGAVSVYRSSNMTLEIVSGLDAYYVVLPGAIESFERTLQAHWLSMKRDVDPAYRYGWLGFLRQALSEPRLSATVYGSRLIHCGDFPVGDGQEPTHRLYLAGVNVDLKTNGFIPPSEVGHAH